MDGFVDTLRLGWDAMCFKEFAYEKMRVSDNPVVRGLVLIVVVGVVIALCGLIGTGLEWASMPDLAEIKDTIYFYMQQMPFWDLLAEEDPGFPARFEQLYDQGWQIFPTMFGAPNVGGAAAGIILVPLGLVVRWLIYGLLAYLFARWLGGTGDLSETLGVLALAVAPQALMVFTLVPFAQIGYIVAVWGILCAYYGLKTAHNLPWTRAAWATLLPFILVLGVLILIGCLSGTAAGLLIGGQS